MKTSLIANQGLEKKKQTMLQLRYEQVKEEIAAGKVVNGVAFMKKLIQGKFDK